MMVSWCVTASTVAATKQQPKNRRRGARHGQFKRLFDTTRGGYGASPQPHDALANATGRHRAALVSHWPRQAHFVPPRRAARLHRAGTGYRAALSCHLAVTTRTGRRWRNTGRPAQETTMQHKSTTLAGQINRPIRRPYHFPKHPKLDRLIASGFDPAIGPFDIPMYRRNARDLPKRLF